MPVSATRRATRTASPVPAPMLFSRAAIRPIASPTGRFRPNQLGGRRVVRLPVRIQGVRGRESVRGEFARRPAPSSSSSPTGLRDYLERGRGGAGRRAASNGRARVSFSRSCKRRCRMHRLTQTWIVRCTQVTREFEFCLFDFDKSDLVDSTGEFGRGMPPHRPLAPPLPSSASSSSHPRSFLARTASR